MNVWPFSRTWSVAAALKPSAELFSAFMAPTLIGGAVAAGCATLGIGILMGLQGLMARSLEADPRPAGPEEVPWGAPMESITAVAPTPEAAAHPAPVRHTSSPDDLLQVPLIAQTASHAEARESTVDISVPDEARLPFQPVMDEPVANGIAPIGHKSRPTGLAGPRGGKPDNLKAIGGIGPKLEAILNDFGIFHFDQIAAWSAEEAGWIEDYLKFPGRVARDRWIDQAKALTDKH